MQKMIPYIKLSKKAKRELDNKQRRSWNELNPVTRVAGTRKYDRNKMKRGERYDFA